MLVALDPGGTTGVATLEYPERFHAYELTGEHHKALYDLLIGLKPQVLIYESFERGPRPAELTSVEYIGVAKLYAQRYRCQLVAQHRSKKALWSDAKLKTLGLWEPSRGHAMDALRHLLLYYTVNVGPKFIYKLR